MYLNRLRLPLVLVAFLLIALHVPAMGAASGSKELKHGEKLYHQLRFNEAESVLGKAISLLSTDSGKANAHLLLGMIYLAQDQANMARKQFAQTVALNPSKTLSSKRYAPDVVRLYNQERARSLGSISITTSPMGATLFINDMEFGKTPVTLKEMLIGEYTIRLELSGYGVQERQIEVVASERSDFHLTLSAPDDERPIISHRPLLQASEGRSLAVSAVVTDNNDVSQVTLHYRKNGDETYRIARMRHTEEKKYEGIIPRSQIGTAGIEYYLTALDTGGNITYEGSDAGPYLIQVIEQDREAPVITHHPVSATSNASVLIIHADIVDNRKLADVTLRYRRSGDSAYLVMPMTAPADGQKYSAQLPDSFMSYRAIEYFIEAVDSNGYSSFSGNANRPHRVLIEKILPYREGTIVERIKNRRGGISKKVVVNVGSLKGFKNGDIFIVFRVSGKVKDPDTGNILAIRQELTGKIKISNLGPSSSQARIVKDMGRGVRQGDFIRMRPGPVTGVGGYSTTSRENSVTWTMSPEPEVTGYTLYRAESPDGPFEKVVHISRREKSSYDDRGARRRPLVDGKKYYYQVRSHNQAQLYSKPSEPGVITTKGGPNPPLRFVAISDQVRHIPLEWDRSQDREAAGYMIYRAESADGPFVKIHTTRSAGTTSFVDEPNSITGHQLQDGKPYWYRIVSYNRANDIGNPSDTRMVVSRARPATPVGLDIIGTGVRSISLAWEMSREKQVVGYRIYRRGETGDTFELVKEIRGRLEVEYKDEAQSGHAMGDNISYSYQITSVNKEGVESFPSETVSEITLGPPGGAANLVAQSGKVRQVKLGWSIPDDDTVVGFAIFRGTNPDNMELIKKIYDPLATEYLDTGSWFDRLENGTIYYYVVRSFNEVGVESVGQQPVTGATKFAPISPANLRATQMQAGKSQLGWDPNPEPDIESYRLLRSKSPNQGFETIATSLVKPAYNDTRLNNGARYYYRVQAVDRDGLVGEPSATIVVRTRPAPSPPSGLQALSMGNEVILGWSPNPEPGVVRYVVYSAGVFGKRKIGETVETSFTVRGLRAGSSYTFVVTAIDRDGLQSQPSVAAKTSLP